MAARWVFIRWECSCDCTGLVSNKRSSRAGAGEDLLLTSKTRVPVRFPIPASTAQFIRYPNHGERNQPLGPIGRARATFWRVHKMCGAGVGWTTAGFIPHPASRSSRSRAGPAGSGRQRRPSIGVVGSHKRLLRSLLDTVRRSGRCSSRHTHPLSRSRIQHRGRGLFSVESCSPRGFPGEGGWNRQCADRIIGLPAREQASRTSRGSVRAGGCMPSAPHSTRVRDARRPVRQGDHQRRNPLLPEAHW